MVGAGFMFLHQVLIGSLSYGVFAIVISHFQVTLCLYFKTRPRAKPLYVNESHLHEIKTVGKIQFLIRRFHIPHNTPCLPPPPPPPLYFS